MPAWSDFDYIDLGTDFTSYRVVDGVGVLTTSGDVESRTHDITTTSGTETIRLETGDVIVLDDDREDNMFYVAGVDGNDIHIEYLEGGVPTVNAVYDALAFTNTLFVLNVAGGLTLTGTATTMTVDGTGSTVANDAVIAVDGVVLTVNGALAAGATTITFDADTDNAGLVLPDDSVVYAGTGGQEISFSRPPTANRRSALDIFGFAANEANPNIPHAGWVRKRTFPPGGRRAHRVQYEVLAASGGLVDGGAAFGGTVSPRRRGAEVLIVSDNDKQVRYRDYFDHLHIGTDAFSYAYTEGDSSNPAAAATPTSASLSTTDPVITLDKTDDTEGRRSTLVMTVTEGSQFATKTLNIRTVTTLARKSPFPTLPSLTFDVSGGGAATNDVDVDDYFDGTITGVSGALVTHFNDSTDVATLTVNEDETRTSIPVTLRVHGYDADGDPKEELLQFQISVTTGSAVHTPTQYSVAYGLAGNDGGSRQVSRTLRTTDASVQIDFPATTSARRRWYVQFTNSRTLRRVENNAIGVTDETSSWTAVPGATGVYYYSGALGPIGTTYHGRFTTQ